MNGNQMDTTCAGIVNRNNVDCSNKGIADLTGIQYFDDLLTLKCGIGPPPFTSGLLTSLPPLPQTLRMLNCSNNLLSILPTLPQTLDSLYCGNNQLTSLPSLPSSLNILVCEYNQLTSLPTLPQSLSELWCNSNQLSGLPLLPQSLTSLHCASNQLTSLPSLPQSLGFLDCPYNQLTSLPPLPQSLHSLYCYNNRLTSLPQLPQSLGGLWCSWNSLGSLPTLPQSLGELYCEFDGLSSLPLLPQNLYNLACGNNYLTSLPPLPQSLGLLDCRNNQLTSLPALPSFNPPLGRLICSNNLLASLPELPADIYELDCSNNPSLTCLPELKRIGILKFSNTSITCLPNYGSVSNSTPLLSSLPLCNIFNNSGCDVLWNISGRAFLDKNNNCLFDGTDTYQGSLKIQLWKSGILQQQTFTADGVYSFDVSSFGTYLVKVDTTNIPFNITCPLNNTISVNLTTADSLKPDNDFALVCKPSFDLAAWSIGGFLFRPANLTTLNISAGDFTNFGGANCATGVSGNVQLVMSGPVSFVSANGLTPASVSGDTITWNVANFGTANAQEDFDITVQTDTSAQLGSQVCFTTSVTPTTGDNNPANNTLSHCFTVVGSFDPNDKQVYPIGSIDSTQEWLTYTVRFQNTGTAEAQHIYIDDTLNANLDESSFQLLAYSPEPIVQVKGKSVRFNFPNINLPDSNANEPESHGYVQYKVKLKTGLPIGTQIHNTANIYFDFNTPVVTNTVTNTIGTSANISGVILTESGTAIPGVVVSLSGDDSQTDTTDVNGTYSFEVELNGSYTFTPAKNNDVTVSNGISGQDILSLRAHILGNQLITSPYKILAADVNGSSSISTLDILLTRSVILGNQSSFPGGALWKFVSSDFVFDMQSPFSYDDSRSQLNILSDQLNQNFIGIKLGDVNDSWDAGVP